MLNVPSQHEKTKVLQAVIKGFFPPWLFYHQISQKCCWKVILDLTWINLYSPEIHIGYFMKYSKIRSPRIGTAADIKTHFGVKSETWEEVLIGEQIKIDHFIFSKNMYCPRRISTQEVFASQCFTALSSTMVMNEFVICSLSFGKMQNARGCNQTLCSKTCKILIVADTYCLHS